LPERINQRVRRSIETRFYTPGCVIATQGQPAEGIFIVRAGWVKTVFQARSDRQFAAGLYGPGNVLALPDVMAAGRFSFSIETIEDSEIEFLSAGDLRSLMVDEPAVAVHLLQVVSKQFLQAMADIHEGTGASTSDRLLRVLGDLAAQCGRDTGDGIRMRLPFTVQHLADRVGCSRQWATKALTELEEKGLVRRSRGWITVSPAAARTEAPEAPKSAPVAPRKSDPRRPPVARSAPCKGCL
jgi:CRP/FNR family transcriptional regulator